MGIEFSSDRKKPEPMVLIPPAFTRNLKTRNRFSELPFTYLFGREQFRELFEHYYVEPGMVSAQMNIRPDIYEDAGAAVMDFGANVTSGRAKSAVHPKTVGGARFRFQAAEDDPYSFLEICTSNDKRGSADIRFCVLREGVAVFGNGGITKEGDEPRYASIGARYTSKSSTVGLKINSLGADTVSAWAVKAFGPVTFGAEAEFRKDANTVWINDSVIGLSFATIPPESLRPGFLVALEARKNLSEFSIGYHHHMVVNRNVKNPFEDEQVKYITNYIDFGLEMVHKTTKDEAPSVTFGGSWQINKNCLVKAKITNLANLQTVVAFKSWWNPSFTFAITSEFGEGKGKGHFGLYVGTENFGMVEYERTTAKFVPRTAANKREVSPVNWQELPAGAQKPEWQAKVTKTDSFL